MLFILELISLSALSRCSRLIIRQGKVEFQEGSHSGGAEYGDIYDRTLARELTILKIGKHRTTSFEKNVFLRWRVSCIWVLINKG